MRKFEDHAYHIFTVLSRNQTNFYCERSFDIAILRVLLNYLRFDTYQGCIFRAQNNPHFRLSFLHPLNTCTVHKLDHANLVDKQFDDTKSSRSDVFGVHPVVLLRRGAVVALVRARRRMSMVHTCPYHIKTPSWCSPN